MASIAAEQVYLVQGQFVGTAAGSSGGKSPVIEQCMVVAQDDHALYQCLAESKPNFRPLGFATLADYESTAQKMRACLNRDDLSWEVVTAPGMSV